MAQQQNVEFDFSIADSLQREKFFSTLSKEDAEKVEKAMTKRNVSKGEVLTKEGEPQKEAFVLQSGKLEKSRTHGETSELGPGSITGFLHLLNSDPSFATVKAVEDSVVWVMSSEAFNSLLKGHDSINKAYISFLSKQLREHSNALQSIRSKMGGDGVLKVAFFDAKAYMREVFEKINGDGYNFKIRWYKEKLSRSTASLASGCKVVCCFVNDTVDADAIRKISEVGVKLIAMRCAGYDNVDLEAAKKHGVGVTRVPAYSPYAVAEFAVTLMMSLNRKIYKACNRVKDFNFSLNGLVGFDMHGKTVGLLGTGQIGACAANILLGFGCKVLAYDIKEDPEMKKKGVEYVTKEELYAKCDIITIHVPLLKSTQHMINAEAFKQMKKGVMIINTSRGAIVDSKALLDALEQGIVGSAGLDVYEGEKAYFFENKSSDTIKDDVLTRLVAAHNVIITSHQAFLTNEALVNIATSTLDSVKEFATGKDVSQLKNAVVQQYK